MHYYTTVLLDAVLHYIVNDAILPANHNDYQNHNLKLMSQQQIFSQTEKSHINGLVLGYKSTQDNICSAK